MSNKIYTIPDKSIVEFPDHQTFNTNNSHVWTNEGTHYGMGTWIYGNDGKSWVENNHSKGKGNYLNGVLQETTPIPKFNGKIPEPEKDEEHTIQFEDDMKVVKIVISDDCGDDPCSHNVTFYYDNGEKTSSSFTIEEILKFKNQKEYIDADFIGLNELHSEKKKKQKKSDDTKFVFGGGVSVGTIGNNTRIESINQTQQRVTTNQTFAKNSIANNKGTVNFSSVSQRVNGKGPTASVKVTDVIAR